MPLPWPAIRIRAWLRRPWRQRAKALGLALLGVCAAGSRSAPDAQEQAKGITISLGADDFEYSDDEQTAVLDGNVTLRATGLPGNAPEIEMESQRLVVSLKPGDVVSEGRTIVRAPGLEVGGDAVRYNLRTREFHAADARAAIVVPLQDRELTVFAEARTLAAAPESAELTAARLTTCEREHPHYALRVRKAKAVAARDRLTIYGGEIELYGVRIPVIPKFNKSLGLKDDRHEFDLDFPGHSAIDGWFYPLTRRFTDPESPTQLRMNLRLAQRGWVAGQVQADTRSGGLHAWATGIRRSARDAAITESLLYDALPEVGAEFSHPLGEASLSARLAGGFYREQDRNTRRRAADGAATLSLGYDWRRPLGGRDAELRAGLGVRGSLYAGGSSYRTIDLHVGVEHDLWRHATGELGFRHHFIGGRTPFEWDDIDLKTEAYGRLTTPLLGPLGVSIGGRYDLKRSLLRDYDLGLHYTHHCLTWSLQYNRAHERFGVGVNLTDFTFGGRPRPQQAPKGRFGPWASLAAQPLQRQGLGELPEAAVPPVAPLTAMPTELVLSPSHQQRAPDDPSASERRPPPSLRIASTVVFP
ncbi:MAG: hypothetical protein FJX74_00760 [Armatimonadetes bacterium]|nr:hypothetical protein [Armatimonadota bacterium]